MTLFSSDEESDAESLNGEATDSVIAVAQATERETNDAGVMICYPEYWIG